MSSNGQEPGQGSPDAGDGPTKSANGQHKDKIHLDEASATVHGGYHDPEGFADSAPWWKFWGEQ